LALLEASGAYQYEPLRPSWLEEQEVSGEKEGAASEDSVSKGMGLTKAVLFEGVCRIVRGGLRGAAAVEPEGYCNVISKWLEAKEGLGAWKADKLKYCL
jgi:hypothetical protein